MIILGIETSCDDTAAAVLVERHLRSSVVSSQDAVHGPYGGIVPELASRHHVANVLAVIDAALSRAEIAIGDVEGIAVTRGPGLIGSLLVGLSAAKGIAFSKRIPLVGVNHLEGHMLAVFLEREIAFPYVALLVSGGHTSIYLARAPGRYRRIGATRDDAAGEAFDKAAKMLGLGFPGGRVIDQLARGGDGGAVRFPRASIREHPYDFSFSGLKTALRERLRRDLGVSFDSTGAVRAGALSAAWIADLAASFQEAVVDMLVAPTVAAAAELGVSRIVVSGGVSANSRLRQRMQEATGARSLEVHFPSPRFCTDNAAMIAYAGARRLERGERDELTLNAVASLPL
ncbi:MAG TPA: tRNA (adenosine(37)-N6)-threonylcarbamoyltransferase complex transferase subunit TsaD [Candidatus Binatia bacterium]|nr:tRNA (adenosine(37)-N6)-threonylcarbamoyltransferase complex transferase subunit TsaD [Candidatus Binatia bacterium]